MFFLLTFLSRYVLATYFITYLIIIVYIYLCKKPLFQGLCTIFHNTVYISSHFHMKIFLLYFLYYRYSCISVVLRIISVYIYCIICIIFIYCTNFLQTKCKQCLHSFLVYIIKKPRRQRT